MDAAYPGQTPTPPRSPRRGRRRNAVVLALAVPAAVLAAVVVCAATVATLTAVGTQGVLVAVEEAEPAPETETGPAPVPPETGSDTAGPDVRPVPPEAYIGASATVGPFDVAVDHVYTDTRVSDGFAYEETAPSGKEYHVYELRVTNEGTTPEVFDTWETTGLSTDGKVFANDSDAEFTVSEDYFWDEINPEETVNTHVVFTAPEGTEFAEVMVSGEGLLEPES